MNSIHTVCPTNLVPIKRQENEEYEKRENKVVSEVLNLISFFQLLVTGLKATSLVNKKTLEI